MAPAVHFQHLFLHCGQIADPRPQRLVKQRPVKGQIFIIHPGEKYVVGKHLPLQCLAPRAGLPQHQGVIRKLKK